jgi:hypothetical protein
MVVGVGTFAPWIRILRVQVDRTSTLQDVFELLVVYAHAPSGLL